MAVTASTMIQRALRLTGEKVPGGTLSTAEQTDYLYDLNSMMDSWSTERLLVYQLLQESFALTASVGTYTIGSGGAFNTTRPTMIGDPCFARDAANYDWPIKIVSAQQYGQLALKTLSGTYPQYLFYDTAMVSGLATIRLYPQPIAGLTLYINSWKQLQQFATINDAIALPPGYQRAIEYNFCVEVSGGYKAVAPEVAKIARESKAAIRALNAPTGTMRMDLGINPFPYRRLNIITGG